MTMVHQISEGSKGVQKFNVNVLSRKEFIEFVMRYALRTADMDTGLNTKEKMEVFLNERF